MAQETFSSSRWQERGGVLIFSVMVLVFVGGTTGGFQTLMLKAVVATNMDFDDEDAYEIAGYAAGYALYQFNKNVDGANVNGNRPWNIGVNQSTTTGTNQVETTEANLDGDTRKRYLCYVLQDDSCYTGTSFPASTAAVKIVGVGRIYNNKGELVASRTIEMFLNAVVTISTQSGMFKAALETGNLTDDNAMRVGQGTGGGDLFSFDSSDATSGSAWDILKTHKQLGADYDGLGNDHYGTFDLLAKSWGKFQGGNDDSRITHWYGAVDAQDLSDDGTPANDPTATNTVWQDANDDGIPEASAINETTFPNTMSQALPVDDMIDWMQDSNNGVDPAMQPRDFAAFETMISDAKDELDQSTGAVTNGWALTNVSGYNTTFTNTTALNSGNDYAWSDFVDASGNLSFRPSGGGAFHSYTEVVTIDGVDQTLKVLEVPGNQDYWFNHIEVGDGAMLKFGAGARVFVGGDDGSNDWAIETAKGNAHGIIKGAGALTIWTKQMIKKRSSKWGQIFADGDLTVKSANNWEFAENSSLTEDVPSLHSAGGNLTAVNTMSSTSASDYTSPIEFGASGDVLVASAGNLGKSDGDTLKAGGRFELYSRGNLGFDRGTIDAQDVDKRSFLYINSQWDAASTNETEYNDETLMSPGNLMIFVKGKDTTDMNALDPEHVDYDSSIADGSLSGSQLLLNGAKKVWATVWAPACDANLGGSASTHFMGALVTDTMSGGLNFKMYWDQTLGGAAAQQQVETVEGWNTDGGGEREL